MDHPVKLPGASIDVSVGLKWRELVRLTSFNPLSCVLFFSGLNNLSEIIRQVAYRALKGIIVGLDKVHDRLPLSRERSISRVRVSVASRKGLITLCPPGPGPSWLRRMASVENVQLWEP